MTRFEKRLARRKTQSVGENLFRAARLMNERAIAELRARTGEPRIRTSHTMLLPHIGLEGTRLTELARRVGVSKQAVGQLVEELESLGMLERVPDAADGRARLVRFSARGRRGLLEGLATLGSIERELAAKVGPRAWRGLALGLARLLEELEKEPADARQGAQAVAYPRAQARSRS